MQVINNPGSYQQPLESRAKKENGKERYSPRTPYREKGEEKETQTGYSKNTVGIARAYARVREAIDAELDLAVRSFSGTPRDRRIWARIAWRVGAEAFHFALEDKLAEDRSDGVERVRNRAAAFQAFLNARFPKDGGAA